MFEKAIYTKYKNTEMKVAEDDNEKKIKLPIRNYIKYLLHQTDDSPLYLFQSGFDELEGTQELVHNYRVPSFFRDDLFDLVLSDSTR